jgi:hypothetical protein
VSKGWLLDRDDSRIRACNPAGSVLCPSAARTAAALREGGRDGLVDHAAWKSRLIAALSALAFSILLILWPNTLTSVSVNAPTAAQIKQMPDNGAKYSPVSNAIIDAVRDCGLPTDGTTDSLAAFNACRYAHPGAHILFPKVKAAGSVDYYFSDSILPKGHGMILEGATGPGWSRGVKLKFPPHKSGVKLLQSQCQQCAVRNLVLLGSEPYTTSNPSQNILPCNAGDNVTYATDVVCVNTGDGVLINANFVTLEHLYVSGFGRHGFNFESGAGEADMEPWSDSFSGTDVTAVGNRGNGFYFHGGDTNAGSLIQAHAYTNQLYGFVLDDFLGNAFYSPLAHTNHQHGTLHIWSTSISNIVGRDGTVTVTAANFPVQAGNSVTITGTTSFNGTHFVVSASDTGHFTFAKAGDTAAETSGGVKVASNDEHFAAAGVNGGGYYSNALNVSRVLVNPYCESDQDASVLPSNIIIIGGAMGCGVGNSTAFKQLAGINAPGLNQLNIANEKDSMQLIRLSPGSTADQVTDLAFSSHLSLPQWHFAVGPRSGVQHLVINEGFYDPFVQGFGGSANVRLLFKARDTTDVQSMGNGAVRFNLLPSNAGSGTGGVIFGSGGMSPARVGSVDSSGKGTFNGGLVTPELSGLAQTTPPNSAAACNAGRIWFDSAYVYVCVATGNIKRAPLTSWK